MSNAKTPAAPKSAADALIEQLAAEQLAKSINPLAKSEIKDVKVDPNKTGPQVAQIVTYANGAVLETYR